MQDAEMTDEAAQKKIAKVTDACAEYWELLEEIENIEALAEGVHGSDPIGVAHLKTGNLGTIRVNSFLRATDFDGVLDKLRGRAKNIEDRFIRASKAFDDFERIP